MTKQEKIQEAYGNWWEFYKDNVNENGWIKDRDFWGKWPEDDNITKIDWETTDHDDDWYDTRRPKLLQGIENNNGWIKINSEDDFPKTEGTYWVYDNINVTTAYYTSGSGFQLVMGINCKPTHYQSITKPQLPIY